MHVNPTAVVGLASSQGFKIREGGFSKEELLQFARDRKRIIDLINGAGDGDELDPNEILKETHRLGMDGGLTFVDVTGGKEGVGKSHISWIALIMLT